MDIGWTSSTMRDPTVYLPHRGDDVENWLKRMRDKVQGDYSEHTAYQVIEKLLTRYRECSDYGLTLRPEDDSLGDGF